MHTSLACLASSCFMRRVTDVAVVVCRAALGGTNTARKYGKVAILAGCAAAPYAVANPLLTRFTGVFSDVDGIASMTHILRCGSCAKPDKQLARMKHLVDFSPSYLQMLYSVRNTIQLQASAVCAWRLIVLCFVCCMVWQLLPHT